MFNGEAGLCLSCPYGKIKNTFYVCGFCIFRYSCHRHVVHQCNGSRDHPFHH
ncbi:hypothetical protein E2L07_14285 [Halalkalibacterium halodurans]|nr:hypothetical protein E2L07_14285 [Halalkalibacterium halodurans]TPE66501.1 hypothetical protein AMD02_018880 [Halalkalibacterium halodurans]